MIYLSGCIVPQRDPRVGWMFTPDMGNAIPDEGWWALDNACFNNPDAFSMERFRRYAERQLALAGDRCLFVVAPDRPFDADGTITRFQEYGEAMRMLGPPVAFVTQDGMGVEDVPWSGVDAVFIGGSTAWKTGHESHAIAIAARERGKWVHMGRVNSERRLRAATMMGCDSVDGTFLKYGPNKNWPLLIGWLDSLELERQFRL